MTEHNKQKGTLRALVLGEDTRSFLSVIRSLAMHGYEVHVVCYDRKSPAISSRYIVSAKFYNYQAYTQKQWLDKVVNYVHLMQFDLVVPCDERAIYPLWSNQNRFPPKTKLAIANDEALDSLFDKWKTKQLALKHSEKVANGQLVNLHDRNYEDLVSDMGLPFVIKPLQSFKEESLNKRQNVAIIRDEASFVSYIKANRANQEVLVEAFFHGYGEGVSVFSVKGELKAVFSHSREAEPNRGGGSSYRKSISACPEQLSLVKNMCHDTQLTGVAMFEFRRNSETQAWILVEVNARFWGSLPLALFSGVDFPAMYADYLCFNRLPNLCIEDYKYGKYSRALISEFDQIQREYEESKEQFGVFKAVGNVLLRLSGFYRVILGKERIDSFTWSDVSPFIKELHMIFSQIVAKVSRSLPIPNFFRFHLAKCELKKLFRVNPDRRLVFICYGNIMRSPFAEKMLKTEQCDINDKEVISFGFHHKSGRSSPESAVVAAKYFDISLEEHSSNYLSQADLIDSDIVFYFDKKNEQYLSSYYQVKNKFCLADLLYGMPRHKEISDPYGMTNENVRSCYDLIKKSINELVDCYERGFYGNSKA